MHTYHLKSETNIYNLIIKNDIEKTLVFNLEFLNLLYFRYKRCFHVKLNSKLNLLNTCTYAFLTKICKLCIVISNWNSNIDIFPFKFIFFKWKKKNDPASAYQKVSQLPLEWRADNNEIGNGWSKIKYQRTNQVMENNNLIWKQSDEKTSVDSRNWKLYGQVLWLYERKKRQIVSQRTKVTRK